MTTRQSDELTRRVEIVRGSGVPNFYAAKLAAKLGAVDVDVMTDRRRAALARRLDRIEALGRRHRAARDGVSAVMHSVRMVHTNASQARRGRPFLDVRDSLGLIESKIDKEIRHLDRPW